MKMGIVVFLVPQKKYLFIYIGRGASSTEPAMLHCHVSTVAHNRQMSLSPSHLAT